MRTHLLGKSSDDSCYIQPTIRGTGRSLKRVRISCLWHYGLKDQIQIPCPLPFPLSFDAQASISWDMDVFVHGVRTKPRRLAVVQMTQKGSVSCFQNVITAYGSCKNKSSSLNGRAIKALPPPPPPVDLMA